MVPAVYRGILGHDLRLVAFSSDGSVLHDQLVTQVSYGDLTGGSGLHWWCGYIFALTSSSTTIWRRLS